MGTNLTGKERTIMSKEKVINPTAFILDTCSYLVVEKYTFSLAFELVNKYNFQLFDSIVAAAALQANCSVLYTEDAQHNQLIENRL